MFDNYEKEMQNLKSLSETLISEGIEDSRFLISLDTAVRYIEGAWQSFSKGYQETVENDYVTDVVSEMTMVINDYLQNHDLEHFQRGCNDVGGNITLYSNRANMQNSASSPAKETFTLPPPEEDETEPEAFEKEEMIPEEDISEEEDFPEEEEIIPIEPIPQTFQSSEMTERSFLFEESAPPPRKKRPEQPHKKKEKPVTKSAPKPRHHEKYFPILQDYFYSDSEKNVNEMERKFTEFKKCVILIEFLNENGEKICSYGLRRGLELGKTEIVPDETTKSKKGLRKVYSGYFFTYHFRVKFNEKNFIKMPSLNGDVSDEIPLSHLNYGGQENAGSLIEVLFVPKKDGFQVKCIVENERKERADFLSEMLNHFDKTEPVGMRSGSGEYDNMVKYHQNGGVWCQYELEPKQEDRNSPDIKTKIMIYLEF